MTAATCATCLALPRRSRRAISESCSVIGITPLAVGISSDLVTSSMKSGTPSVVSRDLGHHRPGTSRPLQQAAHHGDGAVARRGARGRAAWTCLQHRPARGQGLARGHEQQDAARRQSTDDEVEQLHGGRIDPVGVLPRSSAEAAVSASRQSRSASTASVRAFSLRRRQGRQRDRRRQGQQGARSAPARRSSGALGASRAFELVGALRVPAVGGRECRLRAAGAG